MKVVMIGHQYLELMTKKNLVINMRRLLQIISGVLAQNKLKYLK